MAQGRKIRGVFWRDGKWWIRWACSLGHDHRKPSGDLKTAATEEHKAKRAEVREARKVGRECCPRLVRRDRPSTFADLLDRYLKRRDLRASDSTEQDRRRRKERARVEFFRKRFRGRLAGDITSKDIEEVYRELRERALPPRGDSKAPRKSAPATVNRYMKLIHAVLRFGVRQGLISANPASALEFLKENNARNRCLSDEEAGRLMAALPEWLRPLVIVAVHTGMRRGELLDLRWSDADLVNGQLRIRRDKAGDGRWVALNSEALAALKALKRDRTIMSPLVFCSPEGKTLRTNFGRYWRGMLAKAKVHDVRPFSPATDEAAE